MVIKGATITKGQLRAIARVKERQGLDQQKPKKQGPSIRKEEWNDRFFVKEELGSKASRSKSNRRVKRVYDNGKYTRATSPLDMTRIQDALEKVDQDVDVETKLKDNVVEDVTEEIFEELLQDVMTEMVSCQH
ncbi:predicted protein [Chaetoceros tenuissimus]|uniref:Uncharacterized protein n=1 Tax=Chaetoceros tenuissimus TaxID=426638 RepID=A0AAD3CSP8_9STRA|nr:predicted protein [Chaetoceros tenuissimus]